MTDTTTSASATRVLTIDQAGWLSDLIKGVERGLTMRYYQRGAEDAERPLKAVLRAFTYQNGNLYPHDADIRDAYVWTSGMFEHWFLVSDLMDALANAVHGTSGTDAPMAVIEPA
jgi:hypothetical protein